MSTTHNHPKQRPQFTIRAVLAVMLLVGLGLAWRSSLERAERRLAEQAYRLQYAELELERARGELRDLRRVKPDKSRAFWLAQFDGARLRGVTIASPGNVFQRASFQDCDLQNATLQGGGSAFQLARFDRANLTGAKLTGAGASFQEATFVGADLTGAVLTGGGASFQRSSFESATLVGAHLAGSFQSSNISGANFQGADLSALDGQSLGSCYFKEPPSYDAHTKFPAGFDPQKHAWRKVAD